MHINTKHIIINEKAYCCYCGKECKSDTYSTGYYETETDYWCECIEAKKELNIKEQPTPLTDFEIEEKLNLAHHLNEIKRNHRELFEDKNKFAEILKIIGVPYDIK